MIYIGIGNVVLKRNHFIQVTLLGDSGTTYYLNASGEWTLSSARIKIFKFRDHGQATVEIQSAFTSTWKGSSNGLPEDGDVTIKLYYPLTNATGDVNSYVTFNHIKINGVDLGVKGESHTARRLEENPSTEVELEAKLKAGDSDNDAYIGSIEDSNGYNTLFWCKENGGVIDTSKQLKLLNWMARDRMQISGGNSTIFTGNVYGYLPYLGNLRINNVDGNFMTVAWSYDLASNIISAKHERIFTDDIYDNVSVSFEYESDNVITPAIQ